MDPLIFSGDAFSEYYFTRVIWEDTAVKADLDVPGANGALRRAATLISRAQRTLVERQRAASTQSALLQPLAELIGWQLGEPERVETEEGSEEAGAALLNSEGKPLARVRWLAPDAPMDLPSERVHRRFAPTLSMVRVLEEENLTWGLLLNAYELRLIRRAEGFVHSWLSFDLTTIAEDPEDGPANWRLIWGLLRGEAWDSSPSVLDRAVTQAKDHAARVGRGLGQQVQQALVDLIQGILDHPDNATRRAELTEAETLARLYRQALRVLYRCLFVLYGEARGLLPLDIPTYRDSYSLSRLSRLATGETTDPRRNPLPSEGYFEESLRALFELLRLGADLGPEGRIPSYGGGLFDNSPDNAESTALIESLRWGDAVVAEVLTHLTLVGTALGQARVSYRELNVEELGSIYESLLELHLEVAHEELWRIRLDSRECVVTGPQRRELAQIRGEVLERNAVGMLEGQTDADEPEGEQESEEDQEEEDGEVEDVEPVAAGRAAARPIRLIERIAEGRAFLRPSLGRKSSGSYYTNRAFVEFLVRRSVDPLAEGKTPEQILALRCVDPAMGSGHFLVGVTRRLAEHLYNAYRRLLDEVQEAFPNDDRDDHFLVADIPDDLARVWDNADRAEAACRLLVAGNCIYGVDKNELAVDLARVSLWLATAASDHPLSFLDHRLQCGDSLLGYGVDQLLQPLGGQVRDDARLALDGTDIFGVCRRQLKERLRRALSHLKTLGELPPGDFRGHCLANEAVRAELRPFWEMNELAIGLHFTTAPDFSLLDRWRQDLSKQGFVSEETRQAAIVPLKAGQSQQAFCWQLAFPDVWFTVEDLKSSFDSVSAERGFSVVVGNPPWDNPKADSIAFLAQFDPTLATMRGREAEEREAEILADPICQQVWNEYESQVNSFNAWVNASGCFPLRREGRNDLYRLFAELATRLLGQGGHLGMVLSGGIYGDKWTKALRGHLFGTGWWRACIGLQNRQKQYFPGVDGRMKFALIVFQAGVAPAPTAAIFATGKAPDGSWYMPEAKHFPQWLLRLDDNLIHLTRHQVSVLSPTALAIPEFRTQKELDLLSRYYGDARYPPLSRAVVGGQAVDCHLEYMMNRANARLFVDTPTEAPILEGRCVSAYSHLTKAYVSGRGRTSVWRVTNLELLAAEAESWRPQYWAVPAEAEKRLGRPRLQDLVRLAMADVTAPDNERTFMVSVVPPGWVCSSSINPIWCHPSGFEPFALLGILNSFAFEFVGRVRIKNDTRWSHIRDIPCPETPRGPVAETLGECAARLALWHPSTTSLLTSVGLQASSVATTLSERATLRAEVDAIVADLYQLSEEDFAFVLSTFPLLDRDQPPLPGDCVIGRTGAREQRRPKSYLTRDKALLALFDLRGKEPPTNVVEFFGAVGVDISANTGPLRDLRQRVAEAERRGAIAYMPSGRGRPPEESLTDWRV
ncbi:MAG: Eco57I restriction-modification methylase domain-containing protein [Armatimonadota bacterium]